MLGSGVPAHVSMREAHRSPHWYSPLGAEEHIAALYSQTTWTPISMNSCSRFNRRNIQLTEERVFRLLQQAGGYAASDVWGCRDRTQGEPIGYHCWMKSQYQWGCWRLNRCHLYGIHINAPNPNSTTHATPDALLYQTVARHFGPGMSCGT